MTPEAALVELLERVGARHGEGVAVGNHELREWPSAAVEEGERQVEIERERCGMSSGRGSLLDRPIVDGLRRLQ